MADKLIMDKSTALSIAQQIKKISVDNDNAIKALERVNQTLRSGWQADAQRAYEECFTQMKSMLNTYTALLAEYSDTLTKVTNGAFTTDSEYTHHFRVKFGN